MFHGYLPQKQCHSNKLKLRLLNLYNSFNLSVRHSLRTLVSAVNSLTQHINKSTFSISTISTQLHNNVQLSVIPTQTQ